MVTNASVTSVGIQSGAKVLYTRATETIKAVICLGDPFNSETLEDKSERSGESQSYSLLHRGTQL